MNTGKARLGILIILALCAALAVAGSAGSVGVSGLPLFALCAAIGMLLHWLVFVPSYLAQTEHYFDLTGSLSFLATVAVALWLNPLPDTRAMLLGLLIAVWALRLGLFLFGRVKRRGGDGRFDDIKPDFWRFLFTWTLGGAWVFLTMAAALAAMTSLSVAPLGAVTVIGLILWITGFSIEVIADTQKSRFRDDSANDDRFMDRGLWAHSRHPNYFGEILLWFGVACIALPALYGWQLLTLISPFFVTLLLMKVSRVPKAEQKAQERWGNDPAYRDYVQNTPLLIPRLRAPHKTP